ncbi:MAG: M48 family peptidase [Sphingobacteriales bacterium]|nr:MAG: M48 family peptidase [Sphingobacteriales bacterium]
MRKLLFAFTSLALVTTLYSCYKNPVTGRSSLNLVDEGTMSQMASQEYTSFLSTNAPVKGSRDAEMVQRIGTRMAAAVQTYLTQKGQQNLIAGYQWQFNLVNKNEANAWCMPGGKVVVYSGILPLTQNEAGLAVVMGHEIAHAIARHGNERMSQQLAVQAGGQALSAALSSKPALTQNIFNSAYGVGSNLGILKYSREHESEADQMGLIFMALAGYNPNEAISFWQRMATQSGGQKPPEFLSTHPSDATRINQIKKWIPDAMKYYKPQ